MAIRFVKNTGNWASLGIGGLKPSLTGLAKFSAAAKIYILSLTTTSANDNGILTVIDNATTVGFQLCIDALTSPGNPKVRCRARSVSTDTAQAQNGGTTVASNQWIDVGVVIDLTADEIRVYYNGVIDGGAGVAKAFTNTTMTFGTPTAHDTIGGYFSGTPVSSDQFDGHIAECAYWAGDIGAKGFRAFAQGFDPLLIAPASLLKHWHMIGDEGIRDIVRPPVHATITGALAPSTGNVRHPRMIMP